MDFNDFKVLEEKFCERIIERFLDAILVKDSFVFQIANILYYNRDNGGIIKVDDINQFNKILITDYYLKNSNNLTIEDRKKLTKDALSKILAKFIGTKIVPFDSFRLSTSGFVDDKKDDFNTKFKISVPAENFIKVLNNIYNGLKKLGLENVFIECPTLKNIGAGVENSIEICCSSQDFKIIYKLLEDMNDDLKKMNCKVPFTSFSYGECYGVDIRAGEAEFLFEEMVLLTIYRVMGDVVLYPFITGKQLSLDLLENNKFPLRFSLDEKNKALEKIKVSQDESLSFFINVINKNRDKFMPFLIANYVAEADPTFSVFLFYSNLFKIESNIQEVEDEMVSSFMESEEVEHTQEIEEIKEDKSKQGNSSQTNVDEYSSLITARGQLNPEVMVIPDFLKRSEKPKVVTIAEERERDYVASEELNRFDPVDENLSSRNQASQLDPLNLTNNDEVKNVDEPKRDDVVADSEIISEVVVAEENEAQMLVQDTNNASLDDRDRLKDDSEVMDQFLEDSEFYSAEEEQIIPETEVSSDNRVDETKDRGVLPEITTVDQALELANAMASGNEVSSSMDNEDVLTQEERSSIIEHEVNINSEVIEQQRYERALKYAGLVKDLKQLNNIVKGTELTVLDYFDQYNLLSIITPESEIVLYDELGGVKSAKDFVSDNLIDYLVRNGAEGSLELTIQQYAEEIREKKETPKKKGLFAGLFGKK